MTSQSARWRLKSPASWLFTQSFIQGADRRKHQSSASLAFVMWIHWGPVNSPHTGSVTRKMFPFDDIVMYLRHAAHLNWLTTGLIGLDEIWSPTGTQFRNITTQHLRYGLAYIYVYTYIYIYMYIFTNMVIGDVLNKFHAQIILESFIWNMFQLNLHDQHHKHCPRPFLTHRGLVMPYGDKSLDQHWLRYWRVAWRQIKKANFCTWKLPSYRTGVSFTTV